MAWTELARRQHDQVGGKYASDLTDAEWALIEPLMPLRKISGRPRMTRLRYVFDAILYIATTGCQSSIIVSLDYRSGKLAPANIAGRALVKGGAAARLMHAACVRCFERGSSALFPCCCGPDRASTRPFTVSIPAMKTRPVA